VRIEIRASAGPSARVGCAGDLVPGCPDWVPLAKEETLRRALGSCALVVANLESPLTTAASHKERGASLASDPASVRELKDCNIGAVCLANNHIMDCGLTGLTDTTETLARNAIGFFGAGRSRSGASAPWHWETGGLRIAFLGYAFSCPTAVAGPDPEGAGVQPFAAREAERQIAELRQQGCLVCVSCHGGEEFFRVPSPAYRSALQGLAAAGAHLVIGHHAHVFRGLEVRDGCLIAYGLGNFYMDTPLQRARRGTAVGLLLTVELDAVGPAAYDVRFVCRQDTPPGLSLVRGRAEGELCGLLDEWSGAVRDYRAHRREWRRDCFRMAWGMNEIGGAGPIGMLRRAARLLLYAAWRFRKRGGRKGGSREAHGTPVRRMILAACMAAPRAIAEMQKTTRCYRVYDAACAASPKRIRRSVAAAASAEK